MFVDIQAHWHVLLNPIPNTHTHAHACTHTHTHTHTIPYFPLPQKTFNEIIPHKHLRLTEWPSLKSLQIIKFGEGVEKKGTLLHC